MELHLPLLCCMVLLIPVGAVSSKKSVIIAGDVEMPIISLGTCCGSDPTVGIPSWFKYGGIGIDTAFDYLNQPDIAKLIATKNRSEYFITTKIPAGVGNETDCEPDPELALRYVKEDLRQLDLDYVDLVLLHAPCGLRHPVKDPIASNNALWKGLQKARDLGLTRAIGVSNYRVRHLETLKGEKPAVNQCRMGLVPLDKRYGNYAHDEATIAYCHKNNIAYQAWRVVGACPMDDQRVSNLAKKYNKTSAQICMKWVLQRGCILAVGTGSDPARAEKHARDNLDIFEWSMTDDEIDALNNIFPHQPELLFQKK